ncbi:MAG: hypothetical protein HY736_05840 [Verrucomicrobia bacterium]|nr:hypothetical protein [Verrucomicrobiota bacterium]
MLLHRLRSLLCLVAAAAAANVTAVRADPLRCNLEGYTAIFGLTAVVEQDVLTVTWLGAAGAEVRARYAIERAQPIVRELAVRPAGGEWRVLGQDLTPEFTVQTGRRRIDFTGLNPLKALGIDTTSREVIERQGWVAFWDAPFVVPGDPKRNVDLPRTPEEIQRAPAIFNTTSCEVKTDGARLEVNFPGLSMGIFAGGLRFTHYRGTNLLRLEAIAKTGKNLVAYKYDAGLKGFSTARLPRVRWHDTGGNAQDHRFGGARHDGPVTIRAKYRVLIAEGGSGSVAIFPPPTVFFPAREVDTNLGYVWYRKDADTGYAIGIKQANQEDDLRYLQNFALYNAPPETWQRMATYFYVSPETASATRAAVMAFTRDDRFAPLPGYKTMVNHFHLQFTDRLRASGSLDTQIPDLAAMKALGLNIIGLSDFHADKLRASDPGPGRFADQKDYFEACRRASDTDFLVLPWEEPSAYFGGHYNLIGPRPLFFSKVRPAGQPWTEQDPAFGKVYHTGSAEDVQQFLEAENAFWYTAHPRTKSSAGYPDAYQDKFFARSDHFLGIAFKPGMGMDLSELRLAEGRTFDAIDRLNNRYAGAGLRPKYLIGDADTYQKWPHDDLFPGFTVNYLQLERVPGPDEDWSPILAALREGKFFVTTGEVFIRHYAVTGTGARRTVEAEVDWTFPLEFVEVVWGDGQQVGREIVRATDLPPFGTKRFAIPFDATGKKWVRFAVWDSAVNGAFVQPVWLER